MAWWNRNKEATETAAEYTWKWKPYKLVSASSESSDAPEKDPEIELLKLNDQDEHDGEARRIGDYYVRQEAGFSLFSGSKWRYTVRRRNETKSKYIKNGEIEAVREIVKWHDQREREAAKRRAAEKERE